MANVQTSSPPTVDSTSSEKTLLAILDYMENLIALFEEEKSAFELRDMKKFSDIQYSKSQLVTECESRILNVQSDMVALKMVPSAMKERVATTQMKLDQMAEESKRNCKIRAESMERIQSRLLDAARQVIERNKTQYNARGQKAFLDRTRPVATAWNEAI